MITKIRLKHWKSHMNSELEFSPGTNGLVGIVGSGKTSILDAICFGLFGTFPKLYMRKLRLEDVIMKKPVEKNLAEVEVFFTLNNNDYSIKRVIEKSKGTSYSEIKENGKLLESPGTKNVTAVVEKILKVNYELFSKAIYSEQNSVDYFLTIGKGQRMKKIDELLMIDRFEKARATCVKILSRLSERKLEKQASIEHACLEEMEKLVSELNRSIENTKNETILLKKDLSMVRENRVGVEKEIKEFRELKEKFEVIKRQEASLESVMEVTMTSMEKLKQEIHNKGKDIDISLINSDLKEYSKNMEAALNALRHSESKYEALNVEFARSRTNMEFLKNEKIKRLEEDIKNKLAVKSEFERTMEITGDNLNEKLSARKETFQSLFRELETYIVKLSELKAQIEKLSSIEGKCPVCGTNLSDEQKKLLIFEKDNELKLINEKIKNLKTEKEHHEKEISHLETISAKLETMMNEISDLETLKSELDKSRGLLSEYISSAERLEAQLSSMKSEIDETKLILEEARETKYKLEILNSQVGEYEVNRNRLEELKSQRENLKSATEALESNLKAISMDGLETELKKLISKEKEIEMKIVSSDDILRERNERLKENETKIEKVKLEQKTLEKLGTLLKDLKIFNEALRQTQEELRKEFVEAVNFTMNKLWETLYPYQDFVGIRLSIEEGDYVLQLQERTLKWIDVEGTASGGERSIACLALRIAFALVLAPQLRWLVLDEPTHNLDSKSIEDLSQTLRERITDIVDQVFIITHEERLETAIIGNLYRLERDKGKDESTKILQIN